MSHASRTVLFLLWSGACALRAAGDEPAVRPLAGLEKTDAWEVRAGDEALLSTSTYGEYLIARFQCAAGRRAQLRLKAPVPIPAGTTDLTFLGVTGNEQATLRLDAILRDASGKEFFFHTDSPGAHKDGRGQFSAVQRGRRCREVRFSVPGLRRPDTQRNISQEDPRRAPQAPYEFLGLEFSGISPDEPRALEVCLRRMALTSLSPDLTPLYYQFKDREHFGELDPFPYLTPGDYWWWPGTYRLTWEIRDWYEGQPFAGGGTTIRILEGPDQPPLPVQLAQRIEFPLAEEGTYWIRVRIQRTDLLKRFKWYRRLDEYEYRLCIIHGGPPRPRVPMPADRAVSNAFVRVAPGRASYVFGAEEKFVVPVAFYPPQEALGEAARYEIRVRSFGLQDTLRAITVHPIWPPPELPAPLPAPAPPAAAPAAPAMPPGLPAPEPAPADRGPAARPFIASVDLSDQPPGVYLVQAAVYDGDQPYDVVERMVGRRAAPQEVPTAPIPATVPAWSDLLAADEPLFHLNPQVPGDRIGNHTQAWEQAFRPYMDEAATVSTQMEYTIWWNQVEPMSGLFEWADTDRVLDYAAMRGLTVLLRLDFRAASAPEWLPSFYTADLDGRVFGAQMYLVHGVRPNYFHADPIREACLNFFERVAERYRSHPAVQGYYLLLEHPGDEPSAGWREGYEAETKRKFWEHSRERWPSMEELNVRWKTAFPTWYDIVPPDDDASPRFLLDWLQFRTGAIEDFKKDFVRTVRRHDPRRLIMIYGGAQDVPWFVAQGCMSANGGTHDPAVPDYVGSALQGFQMRNEEITPTHWSGTGPFQLDATLYHAAAAGGAHAHVKMFIPAEKRLAELQDPPHSLAKFKQFLPLWRELRQTEAPLVETFLFTDPAAQLLENKSTTAGGPDAWSVFNVMQAHVPVAVGPPELWKKGKLLLLTADRVDILETNVLEQIVEYAGHGGTVLMRADAGRRCVERPDEDWVLLRRFGVAPPPAPQRKNRHAKAVPVPGALLASPGGTIALRDYWDVPPAEDLTAAALFDNDPQRVALSWKPFGRGKVAVVWAETLVPPLLSEGYPFLRDVARWAGVTPCAEATTDQCWLSFTRKQNAQTFYGLVHIATWTGKPAEPVSGFARWLALPDGTYGIKELITDRDMGVMSAAEIREKGIPFSLPPKAVAVFRMQGQEAAPGPQ